MGNIVINGKSYSGRNISISDNLIIIDGKVVDDNPSQVVEVKVEGDIDKLVSHSNVIIAGNVSGGIDAGNNVKVKGSVNGYVDAGNNVQCEDIYGDVSAGNNVRCKCKCKKEL